MLVVLEWLLLIVEVICCFLLVVVILLQKSRSEGLGMAFGASMGENLFGARASNVLTRITIWLGAIFLVTTTLLAILYAHSAGAKRGFQTGMPPAQTQPAGPMMPMPNDAMPDAMPGAITPAVPMPDAQEAGMPAPAQMPVPMVEETVQIPASEPVLPVATPAAADLGAPQQDMPESPLSDSP